MDISSDNLYQTISGLRFPAVAKRECIEFALKYSAKNTDKFLVAYPKSGTNWIQQMVLLILNDGIPQKNEYQTISMSFIDFRGKDFVSDSVIKTHLPFELMPYNKSAKYLLVFRNPKDICVSLFNHKKNSQITRYSGDFHKFFNLWINEDLGYGDYFSHTLSLWSHRFDDNFSFLVYEHMKYNPRDAVLKIGQFLGEEYVSKLTDNNGFIIDKVIQNSTVEAMKITYKSDPYYVRKGIVGDWKSHFTKDESDLVDQKVKQWFSGTGLENLWTEEMKW